MGRIVDLQDKVFVRWTVLGRAPSKNRDSYWHCRCECGTERSVKCTDLLRGISRSCGCLQAEEVSHRNFKHGYTRHARRPPEYTAWRAVKTRCFNSNCQCFGDYGGRGITMCDRWKESFVAFLDDMGHRPGPEYSLERIDHNGHYEPGNCRWATVTEQSNNRRSNRLITHQGVTRTLKNWSRIKGVSRKAITDRLNRGWDTERTFGTPSRVCGLDASPSVVWFREMQLAVDKGDLDQANEARIQLARLGWKVEFTC